MMILWMRLALVSILMCYGIAAIAQDDPTPSKQDVTPFIAYELGEAVFNKFQSYSGEIGIQFSNDHLLRLVHMNVHLTEQHLSSSFAGSVDGPDVEGKFFGFELFYDLPIITEGIYLGPSLGYYKSEYNHLVLTESYMKETTTIGVGISYRETDIFGVKGLYYTFSIPMRISLNATEETLLGETVINNDRFDNNIWLFIGYRF